MSTIAIYQTQYFPVITLPGCWNKFLKLSRKHTQVCLAGSNASSRIPETVSFLSYFNFWNHSSKSYLIFTTCRRNPLLHSVCQQVGFSIGVWHPAAGTEHLTHLDASSSTGPLVKLLLCSRSVGNYEKQKGAGGTSESRLESWCEERNIPSIVE
jgi:hypothetical protein